MKKKVSYLIISILLILSFSFALSACSCSSKHKVNITYDATMGEVEGIGKYKAGQEVTLIATPLEGYVFNGWYSGNFLLEKNSTFTFAMPKNNVNYIANFSVEPDYAVNVSYDDTKGVVTGQGNYKNKQSVTLTATPLEGYLFDGWYSGDQKVSSNLEYTFTMSNSEVNLTANFKIDDIDRILTIKYVYANNTKAHNDYVGNYKFNNEYEIESPVISGYSPDKEIVSGNIKENTTITVTYSPIKYTLKINYVDQDNNPMPNLASYEELVDFDSEYSIKTPTVIGYTADKDVVNGKMVVDGAEITVVYSKNPYTITINYVGADEFTPELYTQGYLFGDSYYIETPTIVGYLPDIDVVQGTISDNLEITVTYTAKKYNLTINYLKNDDSTNLGNKLFANLTYNEIYQLELDNFENENYYLESYTLSGILNINDSILGDILQNSISEDISIDIIYVNHQRIIPIKYVDEEGIEIAQSSQLSKLIGESYEVNAKEIEGYTPIELIKSGDITADVNQEIVFVYSINKYSLTINYVYEDDTIAYQTYTDEIEYNCNYEVKSPEIKGYIADILVVSGNIGKEPVTIKVTYVAKQTGLTINYIYSTGGVAATKFNQNFAFNQPYSITSPVITGYTADKLKVEGVMGEDSVVVTVTYTINIYKLTINYISSVSGFNSVKPATINETLKYNQSYSYTTPSISGLKADKTIVSGKMGAEDTVINVTYTLIDATLTLTYVTKNGNTTTNIQSSNKTHTIDFASKSKTIQIENPYVWQDVGYRPIYTSLKLQIVDKNLQLVGIKGSTQTVLFDNISNNCSYALEFEKIISTVTVKHRLDKASVWEEATQSYTGDYNKKITISYKNFGDGYVPAGTSLEYTFKANNETIYLEYTSIVKKLTINYLDVYGDKIATSYVANLKYNTKFEVKSPEFADYILINNNEATISGTMQLQDLTFDVEYNLNWDTDTNEELIIDTTLKFLELTKNSDLWNRNVKITKNIDMTGYVVSPIGNYAIPFTGNVNGGNYTISNVTINTNKVPIRTEIVNSNVYNFAYVGLFGYANGTIDRLNVSNINITYSLASNQEITVYAGMLVGHYFGYAITKANVTGTINICAKNVYVGGIAGVNLGQITNSSANLTIASTNTIYSASVGGAVGINTMGMISDTTTKLTINKFATTESLNIAGIVSESNGGFITNCSSTMTINDSQVTCLNNNVNKDNICAKNSNTIISN